MSDERGVVETGYDTMADAYLLYIDNIDGDPRTRFLQLLQERLAPGSRIVDIGCGAGVPSTAALAVRHDVLGIDISAEQIRRARENVPAARFEKADVSSVTLPAASVDAVSAFYSLTHVPRIEHETLFGQIAGWLRTGWIPARHAQRPWRNRRHPRRLRRGADVLQWPRPGDEPTTA